MKQKIVISLFLLFFFELSIAQTYQLKGYLKSDKTEKPIENAVVTNVVSKKNSVSDEAGFFLLTVLGNSSIVINHPNYQIYREEIKINSDTTINFHLESKDIDIEAVTVNGNNQVFIKETHNKISLPVTLVKQLPSIGGETDILKSLQLTPGVQNSGENSAGMNVRGGDNAQNLILLDNMPIYNPSHLFGFVSVFNPDAIKSFDFYKGGFSAKYGGRASSIVDIKLKEGDTDSLNLKLNVGLISTKVFFETPIIKDKTYLIYSARSTYLNGFIILKNLIFKERRESLRNIGFYENNLKLTHKFSKNFIVSFGSFYSKDIYDYGINKKDSIGTEITNETVNWSNFINYFSLIKRFSNKSKLSFTFGNTKYKSNTINTAEDLYLDEEMNYYKTNLIYSEISDYIAKGNYSFIGNYFDFNIGADYAQHNFRPIIREFEIKKNYENFSNDSIPNIQSDEIGLYFNSKIKLADKLFFNTGIRVPIYKTGIKTYVDFEPRLSLVYVFNDQNSIKASATKMTQFSYLLSNNSLGMPLDVWVPATENTGYQVANQFSFSYNLLTKNDFNASVGVYYKELSNMIDFKDHITTTVDYSKYENYIENNGIGKAYGVELWLQKGFGDFQGWVSYSYSRSLRQFEEINYGEWYAYKYDRPHNFSITGSYKLNEKVRLSANWVITSGHAVTMPIGIYPLSNSENFYIPFYLYYDGRNNSRMPIYHRLDLSYKKEFVKNNKIHSFSIDVYNAYNKLNAYYLTIQNYDRKVNPNDKMTVWKRTLFPIIPSVSYSLKF